MLNDLRYLKSTYGSLSSFDLRESDGVLFFDLLYGDAKFSVAVHFDSRGVADDTSVVAEGIWKKYGGRWGSYSAMCDHFANSYTFLKHVRHGSVDFLQMEPQDIAHGVNNFNGCPTMAAVNVFISACNAIFNRDESIYKDGNGEGAPRSSSSSNMSSSRPSSSRPSSSSRSSGSAPLGREVYKKRRNGGIVCLVLFGVFWIAGLAITSTPYSQLGEFADLVIIVGSLMLVACIPLFIVGLVKTIKNAVLMRKAR